jgi:hypothetical protein
MKSGRSRFRSLNHVSSSAANSQWPVAVEDAGSFLQTDLRVRHRPPNLGRCRIPASSDVSMRARLRAQTEMCFTENCVAVRLMFSLLTIGVPL